jgi:hypothetical protein
MDDLLKEAIADAKAVRETALENAKIALEEAFTPRLQSMLSKKIQSEIEVDEAEHEDDEEEAPEEGYHEDDEDPTDDDSTEEAMHADDEEEEMEEAEHEDEEEMEEEGVIEINGVKYAPVVSEEEHEEDEMEETEDEDDMDESDDLDLEAVLRELEEEEDDEEEVKETVKEEEDEDGKEVDEEVDNSTGIGSSDNKTGSADKSSGIGTPGKAKHESVEITEEEDDDKEEVEEEIDLEEVIKALSEEEDEEEEVEEVAKLQSDLDEHRNVVKYLRSKLNEVNLLNAKLLFTNKLFRSYGLTNDQKMKVVENFDRAHNLREVKLVYSTLAESFGTKTTKTEIKESKGSASKAVASTKSKKQEQEVIAEGSELRDRFKKLAGII